jgi:putative transposase
VVEAARASGQLDRRHKGRFEVTDEVRERLAFWRGNVAAVHRELVDAARSGGPPAPSRQTLQRAVDRDVLRGDRAGLRHGKRARRGHDVFLQRPRGHRNEVWEADHVEAFPSIRHRDAISAIASETACAATDLNTISSRR